MLLLLARPRLPTFLFLTRGEVNQTSSPMAMHFIYYHGDRPPSRNWIVLFLLRPMDIRFFFPLGGDRTSTMARDTGKQVAPGTQGVFS